jgi:hypothetical protein
MSICPCRASSLRISAVPLRAVWLASSLLSQRTRVEAPIEMRRLVLTVCGIALLLLMPRPAAAAPIIGAQLVATGGEVVAQFMGHSAGFTNELYLFDASDLSTPLPVTGSAGTLGAGLIFVNHTSPVGSQVNLGAFAAGTELVFGIYVQNTQETFYMGPGSRNPDGIAHGAVDNGLAPQFPNYGDPIPAGFVGVGFEDLFGGGDLDYDDLGFAFSNVRPSVPEPLTLSLLGLGFAGLGARRLRAARR